MKSSIRAGILETNHDMNSMLEALGARRYKTHRFYERAL